MLKAVILMLLPAVCGYADGYLRQPAIDVVHYELSLELTDTSDSIAGTARLLIRIRDAGVPGMWLDFADMEVDRVRVRGVDTRFTYGNGRLSFDLIPPCSRDEIVVVEVQYHGKPLGGMLFGKNSYGRRVIFTNNWPDQAHHWFPSVDHPSDKATAEIAITAPEKYSVVSNGRLVHKESLLDGRRLTRWREGKDIPAYCISIGVAEFSILHQPEMNGVPVDWYAYPQDAETAARKFARTALALSYFTDLIGPYPYEKLAQVQATIGPGAMENASAIFYDESLFRGVPLAENPVPHEIAHQWFGNSLSVNDWDQLWLSEGFATYFEALFYEHLNGPEALKQAMAAYFQAIGRYDHSAPIVDPGLTDLMKKLNPLNYQKGAWVLHMLRGMLGDAKFFEGMRRYYALHEGSNVSTEDFQNVMESVSGTKLSAFFRQWLYQGGWPEYRVVWRWDQAAGKAEVDVQQRQSTGLFDMPLSLVFSDGSRRELQRIRVMNPEHTFRIALPFKPSSLEVDPDGWVMKSLSLENR